MKNKTNLIPKAMILLGLLVISHFPCFAQYLPLNGGGYVSGSIVSNFIPIGTTLDLAPGGTITGGTVFGTKGAIGRDFYSLTALGPNESFIVDLGSSLPVAVITFGTWFSQDPRFIPLGYNIDYSDDNSNWTNLVSITSNNNLTPVHPGAQGRFWRLTVTACQSGMTTSNISGFQLISSGLGSAVSNNLWSTPWVGANIFTYSPVCIGGTYAPPNYKLSVNGSAIATSMTVKLDIWSDYVLKKGYRLRPLSEVKQYIADNSHLPDLPSQKEVISQGLDLGQINNLLTKKVEELTLYVLALDKKQKKQEHINHQLESELSKVRAKNQKISR